MARPTENAKRNFQLAAEFSKKGITTIGTSPATKEEKSLKHLAEAIWFLSQGLEHLSDGLRATYILLEEVNSHNKR